MAKASGLPQGQPLQPVRLLFQGEYQQIVVGLGGEVRSFGDWNEAMEYVPGREEVSARRHGVGKFDTLAGVPHKGKGELGVVLPCRP